MKTVKIPQLKYESTLGTILLKNAEVSMDIEDYEKFKEGQDIEEIDYGLSGKVIEKAERLVALEFFRSHYQEIIEDRYQLKVDELVAIQELLKLNTQEFATLLGIDKGSLTNIRKRGKMSHPVRLLAIERLGMDLARAGSAKGLVDKKASIGKADNKMAKEINEVRFGTNRKVS